MQTLIAPKPIHSTSSCPPDVVSAVADVLTAPAAELDYARAKVTLDALVDPALDREWTFAELDRLTQAARAMAGVGASALERLRAVRTVIYQAEPWNGYRPFDYDHENFKDLRVKLLSHYLESRRGNCVSMPILFLILADRLGLEVSLAMATAHLFVRWRDEKGAIVNLEATSGATPARDVWMKEATGYSERGAASGFYMRSLPRREGVAAMALTVVEHLMARGRYRDALAVTIAIVRANPRDGIAWANQGQAACRIIDVEFLDRYGSRWLIPPHLRPEYMLLVQRNHHALANAERLGWEPTSPAIRRRI